MKVTIRKTEEHHTLSLVDPSSGIDWIADFIGNHGALADGQFERDDETGGYLCDQLTYDWWAEVIADNQALEDWLHALRAERGADAVNAIVAAAGNVDLEDLAAAVNAALDEKFGAAE